MRYLPATGIAIGVAGAVILGLYFTKNANCLWGLVFMGFAVDAVRKVTPKNKVE